MKILVEVRLHNLNNWLVERIIAKKEKNFKKMLQSGEKWVKMDEQLWRFKKGNDWTEMKWRF